MAFILIGLVVGILVGGLVTPLFYIAREASWKRQYVALEDAYGQVVEELADTKTKNLELTIKLDYERRLNA